jgi:hypothetical protein
MTQAWRGGEEGDGLSDEPVVRDERQKQERHLPEDDDSGDSKTRPRAGEIRDIKSSKDDDQRHQTQKMAEVGREICSYLVFKFITKVNEICWEKIEEETTASNPNRHEECGEQDEGVICIEKV